MIPDDNLSGVIPGIQRPPEICVDYLSHDWKKEDDIWTSWKVMSKQKKEIANGIRLENASWRTWAKQKYHLKTVNPEKLNWLKDSDVTWLYGPLHTAWTPQKKEDSEKQKTPSIQDKLGLMGSAANQKSCLKKKSISEQLLPPLKRHYPSLVSSNSDTQLYKKDEKKPELEPVNEMPVLSTSVSESSPLHSLAERRHQTQEHHIRFNDRVEQFIAVDSAEEEDFDVLENEDDTTEDGNSSSSDDGAIIMKNSRRPPPPKKKKDCSTIFKLAPTKLKTDRLYSNEYSALYSNNNRLKSATQSSIPTNNDNNNNNSTSSSTTTTTTTTSSSVPVASYDYQTYNNYSHYDDDLDDDLVDMGVFTTDMFCFDPSTQVYGSPPNTKAPSSRDIPDGEDKHRDDDGDGIVDRAVHLATGVRDIMSWASGLVFNSQVF